MILNITTAATKITVKVTDKPPYLSFFESSFFLLLVQSGFGFLFFLSLNGFRFERNTSETVSEADSVTDCKFFLQTCFSLCSSATFGEYERSETKITVTLIKYNTLPTLNMPYVKSEYLSNTARGNHIRKRFPRENGC